MSAQTHPLEPDRAAMEAMGHAALALVADFVDGLPNAPAANFDEVQLDRLVNGMLMMSPPESPGSFGQLLGHVREAAAQAVETAGPGYMAYIPGGGLFASALAELMANVFNRYTALSSFAPAFVAMENNVLSWIAHQFGVTAHGIGLATTGGSLATLTAIVAARHDRLGDRFDDGTLYVTAYTHRSVAKAARVAGFRADQIRIVPTTPQLRMDRSELRQMVRTDRAAGLRPFLVVATAGTTDTGTVDPLADLAEIAQAEELWFHVDGAYGGFFQLTERGRQRLAGIEAADSIVLDPHKGMFLPYGTGVLLVGDHRTLQAVYAADGAYLQDVQSGLATALDFANLGPELTREFRGLRLFLPLYLHGVAAFRDALDEKLDLAAYAYDQLAAIDELVLPGPPDLSTVVFRADTDERSQQLLEEINASRRVYLSSTRINGRYILRMSILSHRTHHEHVAEAVDIIRHAAAG